MKRFLLLIALCLLRSHVADAHQNVGSAIDAYAVNAFPASCAQNQRIVMSGSTFICSATNTWTQIDWTMARVTGSNTTTTGQVLAGIAGLSVAIGVNGTYECEAVLSVQSSSVAGNQYGMNYSAAGGAIEAQATGTLAVGTQQTVRIAALNTATVAFVTSGATGGMRITGVVTTGSTAGNLVAQHLKVTSGTSTVFINSFLRVRKLA